MLADIRVEDGGYIAYFTRQFRHSSAEVWSYLTENEKLKQWFSELQVDKLGVGGVIRFDMRDGTFIELEITEFKPGSVLEYTWGADRVRFELYSKSDGCRLLLVEKLSKITAHTPKDLAGWHVCLDMIQVLLGEKNLESREEEWKIRYREYAQRVGTL